MVVTCAVNNVEICAGQLYSVVVTCVVQKVVMCYGNLYGCHLCGPESWEWQVNSADAVHLFQ